MGVSDSVIREFAEAIKQSDTVSNNIISATVSKVDDEGVVWVYLAGSDIETPTASSSAEVKKGDSVTVEWRNNSLYIMGNVSNPSAGSIRVNEVEMASNMAREAAENAVEAAEDAKATAEVVHGIAEQAKTDAGIAKSAANESLKGLSMTQEVLDVVNWVATHGVYVKATTYVEGTAYYTVTATEVTDPTQKTDELVGRYYEKDGDVYVKTADTQYDDSKTYYNVTGTPVSTPKAEDIAQYYTLNVKDAMGDYINKHLALTNEGLYVMSDGSDWKVLIDDSGVYIVNPDNEKVTKYMDSITLGKDDGTQSYLYADYHSLRMIDKEGTAYVYLSDLRDLSGVAQLTAEYIGDGTTTAFEIDPIASNSNYTVKVNGIEITSGITKATKKIEFETAPAEGDGISITYTTTSESAKAYTFGTRGAGTVGALSLAEGWNTTANGSYSHAEGSSTTAMGSCSHAEGMGTKAKSLSSHAEGISAIASGFCSHAESWNTTASGSYSHAEGDHTTASGGNSHAEGWNTTASGSCSHAEGKDTTASGSYSHAEGSSTTALGKGSHAQNLGTVARYEAQTAIGRFNQNKNDTALEIGNGTDDDSRSNTLEVTWDGKVRLPNKQSGVYLTDQSGFLYPLGYDNGTNLWIGSDQTAARHHRGATIISSGYNGTAGNKSIKISVPNADNNNASNYDILHTGYAPTTPTIAITDTLGTRYGTKVYQFGKVVQLLLRFQNSNVTQAGKNLYTGTINTTGLRPIDNATGVGYYGQQVFSGMINKAGAITVRNASSTDQPEITGTNNVIISFTYLIP